MHLQKRRIYLVEDDLNNKIITQMLLEKEGATVVVDRWGLGIENRIRKHMPLDAVLLDLNLSGNVSGFELFKRIREITELKNVPIVAVTSADALSTIPQAQALGFAGFISKPIDFVEFGKQISRLITGESIWLTSNRM